MNLCFLIKRLLGYFNLKTWIAGTVLPNISNTLLNFILTLYESQFQAVPGNILKPIILLGQEKFLLFPPSCLNHSLVPVVYFVLRSCFLSLFTDGVTSSEGDVATVSLRQASGSCQHPCVHVRSYKIRDA